MLLGSSIKGEPKRGIQAKATMSNSEVARKISFATIAKGLHKTVDVTEDELIITSDLVSAVMGNTKNRAAEIIRKIKEKDFDPSKFIPRHVKVKGNIWQYIDMFWFTLFVYLHNKIRGDMLYFDLYIKINYINITIFLSIKSFDLL